MIHHVADFLGSDVDVRTGAFGESGVVFSRTRVLFKAACRRTRGTTVSVVALCLVNEDAVTDVLEAAAVTFVNAQIRTVSGLVPQAERLGPPGCSHHTRALF